MLVQSIKHQRELQLSKDNYQIYVTCASLGNFLGHLLPHFYSETEKDQKSQFGPVS